MLALLQNSFILLQALEQNLMPLTKPGPKPRLLARHRVSFFSASNNRTTMGTDGSSGAGTGAPDPHDCEAAHYVVTNHRPGSVHLTARCSFLGPDTQVS